MQPLCESIGSLHSPRLHTRAKLALPVHMICCYQTSALLEYIAEDHASGTGLLKASCQCSHRLPISMLDSRVTACPGVGALSSAVRSPAAVDQTLIQWYSVCR